MTEEETARALVVDDDPSMRAILRHLLELEGWEVTEAETGAAALKAYRVQPPDLVLTDLEMPRMSGEELARQLREEQNGGVQVPPLVAISRRVPESGSDALFDGVLRKPVTLGELRSWLTR